jgi:hypothetical protein
MRNPPSHSSKGGGADELTPPLLLLLLLLLLPLPSPIQRKTNGPHVSRAMGLSPHSAALKSFMPLTRGALRSRPRVSGAHRQGHRARGSGRGSN